MVRVCDRDYFPVSVYFFLFGKLQNGFSFNIPVVGEVTLDRSGTISAVSSECVALSFKV